MPESFEGGEGEDLFGGALSPHQRQKLCAFLEIPDDSTDRQIVWAYMSHAKAVHPDAPREVKDGVSKITETQALRDIVELWGGENEFPEPRE